jgi:hypothetical protein
MTKYVTKLYGCLVEILTEEELAEYLHFFSKKEIKRIKEIHKYQPPKIR